MEDGKVLPVFHGQSDVTYRVIVIAASPEVLSAKHRSSPIENQTATIDVRLLAVNVFQSRCVRRTFHSSTLG